MKYFLDHLSLVEQRYNGPIPAAAKTYSSKPLKGVLLKGLEKHARDTLSIRRRGITAKHAAFDPRLADLCTMLTTYRHADVGYRIPE